MILNDMAMALEKLEGVMWYVALFLRDYLGPGRPAFEFYQYNRDGIVTRITESDAVRDGWPVAAARVVAHYTDPDFLGERLKEIKSIPVNFRFIGTHERLLMRMGRRKEDRLISEIENIGAGFFVYTLHPNIELRMEPRCF